MTSAGAPQGPGNGPHELVLVRHGQTDWSRKGRHTGRTDVPLNDQGRAEAAALAPSLAGRRFAVALTSPLQRAAQTARLALGRDLDLDPRLVEWDYGRLEGLTNAQWRAEHPQWRLFRDGAPGGETASDVGRRADGVLADRVAPGLLDGDVIVVAHGHLLRILAARFLGQDAAFGARLQLAAGAWCVLGYDHGTPAISTWNRTDP